MVKKRLIFTYLFDGENCMLSRNFRLQKVGTVDWIKKHYNFESIAFSIDELILINVSRNNSKIHEFCNVISDLSKFFLMPIAAGGNIRSFEDAKAILRSGADKIILNTPLFNDRELVEKLINSFGSQCIVASIDYLKQNGDTNIYINNGKDKLDINVYDGIRFVIKQNVGEIYLTSMEKDGTGMGFDIDVLKNAVALSPVPIIASGGAGDYLHIAECFKKTGTTAVSTANLFNFLGNGLHETRKYLIKNGFSLAEWSYVLESENQNLKF
jgi:imidazole glycerol-phosphate synthase subunit HisF